MVSSADAGTKEKWAQLITKVIALTRAGKLTWEEGINPGSYILAMRHGSILISEGEIRVEHGEPWQTVPAIKVRIHDDFGDEVDAFNDEDIGHYLPDAYSNMHDLISTIRRKISDAETVLNNLISELEDETAG